MRRFFVISIGLVVVLAIAGAGVGYWLFAGFTRPGPSQTDKVLIIPPGTGVNAIAQKLEAEGVILDSFVFRVGVRLLSDPQPMKAGEYLFPSAISSQDTVRLLQAGKTVVRRITFAEGLTSAEIMEQLNATSGLVGTLTKAPAEGTLLPETYHYSYGDQRADLVQRMAADMEKLVADLWSERDPGLPIKTPEEAVVLASIVEKETGQASERPQVAGVFINRLRKGMRLQSDPTVVYGITQGSGPLGRPLRLSELRRETAFNTYTIKGLPPTPIANPGRESLFAVLHPQQTDALYFVADGTGGHVFSRTLNEHNRNVARWRKIERQRKNQTPGN